MKDTRSIFENRALAFEKKGNELKNVSRRLSLFRILTFMLTIVLIVRLADAGDQKLVGLVALTFLVVFFSLLKWHNRVRLKVRQQEALKEVNQEELKRLSLNLKDLLNGTEYYDQQHPYHEDLDIFGKHSLFQLINRSATSDGSERVATWLSAAAEKDIIKSRQGATKALIEKIDFRQNFQSTGRIQSEETGSKEVFLDWLNKEDQLKNKLLFKLLLFIIPALSLSAIIGASLGLIAVGWPLLMVVINFIILGLSFGPLDRIGKQTENGYKSIGVLKDLIALVESENFAHDHLIDLQARIKHGNRKATQTLSQLKFLLDSIHNRANLMYVVFDALFILDVYWLLRIHHWKNNNRLELKEWFDVMAEFDALNSLAGFAYANPNFNFPEISDESFFIESTQLGHPLIPSEKRVNNDFSFHGRGGICLITGSNMSGKSTFLRTLGVNMVLAQSGAPVCADKMIVGKMQVFTSMRTTDELEENVSSFYAELKRLKKLLESISEDHTTLFMIDEVLKGTNSEDRHKGAIALIKQLNRSNAFGLVSTHDLVLGSLANQLKGVKNYSFNSEIKGDEINFDYTLTDGICKSFNATKLMQNMGIDIPDE